jgi:hypothetical protein
MWFETHLRSPEIAFLPVLRAANQIFENNKSFVGGNAGVPGLNKTFVLQSGLSVSVLKYRTVGLSAEYR